MDHAAVRSRSPDFGAKPTAFAGLQCKKCHCQTVFASRFTPADLPLKLLGFVPCRCGGCLDRFWVPFWRARKR